MNVLTDKTGRYMGPSGEGLLLPLSSQTTTPKPLRREIMKLQLGRKLQE